jgi:hypothetical protein
VDHIETFDEFAAALSSPVAHTVGGAVFPFPVPQPALARIVDESRRQPQARIAGGLRGDRINQTLEKSGDDFAAMPLEAATQAPVHISLFDLGDLRLPGGALHQVVQEVYLPLAELWRTNSLVWQKVYPILFLSGPGCSTNYHWDPSSVLVIQLSGRKRFHSLRHPLKWCPADVADQGLDAMIKPSDLPTNEVLYCDLEPGDAVWSPCRAPHWVDADDATAFSLSIAFTAIEPGPDPQAEMVVV